MDALVALVFISVFGQTHSYVCPRSNARGLYPDPEDCSKYYQCVDGGRYYHKSCPPGLWFDSRYSICNWPGYVSCHTRRPEIQPLASEESDPVLSGTIQRYPQQLGRQVYTTRKRPTFRTLPTTRTIRRRTTRPARVYRTSKITTLWTSRTPDVKTRTPRSPQTEKPTTHHQQMTTKDPSPGPISTSQSVLDWLYEDNQTDDMEVPQTDNAHPQAPPKPTQQTNPINNVASMDEYGGFDDTEDYQNTGFDTGFEPPPECSAAFSLELDPTRCEGFYQCYLWIPYPKVCPAGLLFDHQSNVCNWPEYVYCLNGERYDPPETTTTEQVATRAPATPPAPSNNFNPQENGGFLEDNNYDDYWPIEEVMEGKRHQTAFKKKGLQAVSSQMGEEETQKKSTPRVKATTLMMNTDAIKGVHNGCGRDGCEAKGVKTSDYKSQPKAVHSEVKDTTEKETTTKVTSTEKVNDKQSNMKARPTSSSQETSESKESSSDSASNETESNESSMESSKEFNGAIKADSSEEQTNTKAMDSKSSSQESSHSKESMSRNNSASKESESSESTSSSEELKDGLKVQSSKENNEIIKPELTSNNLKIKENEIQVDIVEITGSNENKLQEQDLTAKTESSRSDAVKLTTDASVSPATEKETREENNSNATRIEVNDKTNNETNVQEETNSADDTEGSGSELILSKIDILRNAVESFTGDDKQTTTPLTTEAKGSFTNAKVPTNETEVDSVSNITNDTGNMTSSQQPSMVTSTDVTSSEMSTPPSTKIAKPLFEKADEVVVTSTSGNETEGNVTAIEETLDSILTEANVTGAAEGKSEKNLDTNKSNTTELDSTGSKNQTENSTVEADLPDEGLASNETIGNDTGTGSNVTTSEPLIKEELNSTANSTHAATTETNTTEAQVSTNSTSSSTSTLLPPKCRGGNCQRQKDFSTTPKTKSGPEISRTSSKTVEKAKAKRPDIVMLSGKSPIARILEKLLNIRMKQIGNNKFKAVETRKETFKGTEVLSENKIKPKSQNDEGRTTLSHKATSSSEMNKTTPGDSSETRAKNASTTSPEVSPGLTTAISTIDINVTVQSTSFSDNSTSTGLPDDTDPANISISLQNITDNVNLHDVFNQANDTTIAVNINAKNSTNTTIVIMESTTVVITNSTNDTSTFVENSTVLTTSNKDLLATAAAAHGSKKGSAVEALNTTMKEAERTTETTLSSVENIVNETDANSSLPDNATTTTNSSSNITDSNPTNLTLTETNFPLNTKALSNTSLVVNSTEEKNFSISTTTKTSEKATVNVSSDDDTPARNSSSTETDSSLQNSSTTGNNTSVDQSTTKPFVNATQVSETNGTTTTQTTPRTSRKQREIHRPARKPTHFRQVGNSPHFEARKVFGGPDEKWRFSDGTLVDQFSRQQRDVDALSATSFAASKTPSLLISLMTVIFIRNNLLA